MCGWYQYSPWSWVFGILMTKRLERFCGMLNRTLSLFPLGETAH